MTTFLSLLLSRLVVTARVFTVSASRSCGILRLLIAIKESISRRSRVLLLLVIFVSRSGLEVAMDVVGEDVIIEIRKGIGISIHLLVLLLLLLSFPLAPDVLNLILHILLRIIGLADTSEALPPAEMPGVNGNTVVFGCPAISDKGPAALLLLEIETGRVGKEEECEDHSGETEPRDDVELGLRIDVVVEDTGEEGASLADTGGQTVSSGADRGGEDLTSDEEGDAVGAELVEETAKEVHGLESMDVHGFGVVVVVERGDDEHDEAHEESDLLHHLATIELVVNQERSAVVAGERDDDVDHVPDPARHDAVAARGDDLDELALEELVAVEEDVVAEPGTGGGEETATELAAGDLEGRDVVAGDVALTLGNLELSAGVGHLVGTVVHEPEGTEGGQGKGDAEGPLNGNGTVRGVTATVMEDEEQDHEEALVDELTPTLHEESHGDLSATVKSVLAGRKLASADSILHR